MKDALRYRVTITATVQRTEICGKEWKQLTAEKDSAYGYTPEIEKVVQRDVEVLSQVVDDLDLSAVIKAINGL